MIGRVLSIFKQVYIAYPRYRLKILDKITGFMSEFILFVIEYKGLTSYF